MISEEGRRCISRAKKRWWASLSKAERSRRAQKMQAGHKWDKKERKAYAKHSKELGVFKKAWKDPEKRARMLKGQEDGRKRRWAKRSECKKQSENFKALRAKWERQGKITEWQKERWKDPEYRKEILATLQAGRKKHGRKIAKAASKSMKRKLRDPEFCEKRDKGTRRNWRDPEYRKRMVEAWRKGLPQMPSKPQRSLLRRLSRASISGFQWEYPFEEYSLDIVHPLLKLCIEVNGRYWHSVNDTNYRRRTHRLKKAGWKVLNLSIGRKVANAQWLRVLKFIAERGS